MFSAIGSSRFRRPMPSGSSAMARWGMPSSQRALIDATKKRTQKLEAKGKSVDFKELLRIEPDSGTTNIRNVNSAHWKRWLGPEHRCLMPFSSFLEYDTLGSQVRKPKRSAVTSPSCRESRCAGRRLSASSCGRDRRGPGFNS